MYSSFLLISELPGFIWHGKYTRAVLLLLILFSFTASVRPQSVRHQKQWDKIFGGSHEDRLRAMVATTDGGYLLGGSSYSGIGGDKTEPNKAICDIPCYNATPDYW